MEYETTKERYVSEIYLFEFSTGLLLKYIELVMMLWTVSNGNSGKNGLRNKGISYLQNSSVLKNWLLTEPYHWPFSLFALPSLVY